ncbi:MAG: GNAT family N-acetyltransferase [Candidatus Diapherotrites archaeon]|mgnify:CR=1 FL=1|jgi:ribosomal protein S18 acetylase RimI-like enzyme|uniref:GNAT family N-acetyltransferase n=1 Tax=Candidatus Iainarchaeum sp. TaxID=3101447 RepID=A0A8T5GDV6_9ARCH|nr:GNAT family N-acetyltransferase [Candidatus Diapherotrites archaeon]
MYLVNKVKEKDCAELSDMLQDEFPYIDLSKKKISEKLGKKNFFLIKCHQKNIILGFAELNFLEKKARLNAIFVEEAFRGQGIATKLIHHLIHESKRRRIHTIFLLVKERNFPAKELYIKNGFDFKEMHNKELDGSKVEVWEKHIN